MNKEVLKRGKMTNEGRLKIRNIRKNKVYLSIISVSEFFMAFIGSLSFILGLDLIYNVAGNNTGENGRIFNSLLSLLDFGMSYLSFCEVKNMKDAKENIKDEINEIHDEVKDEIEALKAHKFIENSNNCVVELDKDHNSMVEIIDENINTPNSSDGGIKEKEVIRTI